MNKKLELPEDFYKFNLKNRKQVEQHAFTLLQKLGVNTKHLVRIGYVDGDRGHQPPHIITDENGNTSTIYLPEPRNKKESITLAEILVSIAESTNVKLSPNFFVKGAKTIKDRRTHNKYRLH